MVFQQLRVCGGLVNALNWQLFRKPLGGGACAPQRADAADWDNCRPRGLLIAVVVADGARHPNVSVMDSKPTKTKPRPRWTAERRQRAEDRLDEGLRETFPASDPVAAGHPTGTEPLLRARGAHADGTGETQET